MGFLRAMATLQGATLLPEDRFINTFHFEWFGAGATYETSKDAIAAAVKQFYITDVANSRAVRDFLSPFVVSGTISTYDLSLPEGEREPTEYPMDLPAQAETATMPEECCICLTLTGDPPITPRRRGRLYIGPLTATNEVIEYGSPTGPTRVQVVGSSSVANTIQASAHRLISDTTNNWVIRSVTPSENFVQITGGYVDNAFDTQRRRGPDPSVRLPVVG